MGASAVEHQSPVEIGSFNMNKLIVLALFAGLYFCGVAKVAAGKGKALVNTKCLQLISCNGVCSIDAPGSTDEWEEDTDEDCDRTRGCKCWKPTVSDSGGCTATDAATDRRPCVNGAAGGPPSISTYYNCQNEVCKPDADNGNNGDCYFWSRKPCDVSICDSFRCVKRYRKCHEKKGVCAHKAPEDGWTQDGICHKYNDCKCWVKDE